MKTYSSQVFKLIKAMTPKEKFFFKAFYVKKQENAKGYFYIVLFDILNNMEAYDDRILKKKLKESGFNHSIAKAKNYLMKALLKSLEEYYSDSSVNVEIHSLISQAEILYKKNLKKVADQMLYRAEKLSTEFEKHEYLLIIYSLRATQALDMADLEAIKEFAETGVKKRQNYLDMYSNTILYSNLAIEIGRIYNASPQLRVNKATDEQLKKIFSHPLLRDSNSALTFSAKQHFYKLHYQHVVNQTKWNEWEQTSYNMLKEWEKYLEKKDDLRTNFPEVYIQALAALTVNLGVHGGKKESETLFNKARDFFISLPKKSMNHSVRYAFADMFTAYADTQLKLLTPEKCIEAYIGMNSPKLGLAGYGNMGLAYFLLGRHSESLACINKILNSKSEYRMDVQAMAKIFILIVHYELKNIDLLPYAAKASERWFAKHNLLVKSFDKELLNFFIYKLPKIDTVKEEWEELSRLLTLIKQEKNPDYSVLQNEEFYLIPWLESKVQNRPLLEVAKGMKRF